MLPAGDRFPCPRQTCARRPLSVTAFKEPSPVNMPQIATRFELKAMSEKDCGLAAALSQEVGWPHRAEDWRFLLALGKGLVAWRNGHIAGTALWWRYGGQARIGMVIVDPKLHRSGIGRTLVQAALVEIDEPTVILNSTLAGEALYRSLGFSPIGSIVQHQGSSTSIPPVPLRPGERIRPLGRQDAPVLAALDAQAMGADRAPVIEALIEAGEAVVLDDGGKTVGFAFCRRFGRGQLIGPVIARDSAAARALIAYWLGLNAGQFVRVDVTGESGLSHWLDEVGLSRVPAVETMLRGLRPPEPHGCQVFAVASHALG
jgi:GNAT superfamily N-acetyltransferase